MLAAKSCLRGSRLVLQLADRGCRQTFTRPSQVSVVRCFRWSPINFTSMRTRFGRSQAKGRADEVAPEIALDAGRMAVAAAAVIGLGGLCYYGLSMVPSSTDAMSAIDRATVWPDYVRQRVKMTYAYLAGGVAIAAGTAASLSRSPAFCRAMVQSGWIAPITMMLFSMGAGFVCQLVPYPATGVSTKHLAWAVFSASIGGMLMPVCLLGGPILTRAALYTGGIVGGLSAVAISAPSDKFLTWGGPLAIGLGVVVVSSLGSMFLSPASRLGSGMAAISLYGGLLLFSGFLLYDTQLVIRRAELHPAPGYFPPERPYGGLPVQQGQIIKPFDPINNSIHILMDTVNIFVRMVAILAGGQRRK
ncbi:Growth hormone-inducible transmembrane protein [Clonorchis sinensis]|uniref:Growth hormone-inducible transmembrane protein n=1 Tax=Clonorchis sinensis TaxID=79923 RepID=A0A3R7DHJ7_CLOSI|nr:Growth hormone-inducible transmembrane protein [Clonorchis sinensis]